MHARARTTFVIIISQHDALQLVTSVRNVAK
jgi:hypothetical protein